MKKKLPRKKTSWQYLYRFNTEIFHTVKFPKYLLANDQAVDRGSKYDIHDHIDHRAKDLDPKYKKIKNRNLK